jgi:hypothetical protein
MTPAILEPLQNVIIWAQHSADPIIWQEAARRYVAADREIGRCAEDERRALEESIFHMLPSEWPLWMESCRFPQSSLIDPPGSVLRN